MSETLVRLLLRLSEAGEPALLWGHQAAPYFGREFERLLARGVLVEHAPADEWDVCSTCDCGLDARPIQVIDGQPVASCPFDHRNDQVLRAEDLRSFRIDSTALVREIAIASGLITAPSEIMPGLWHLGQMTGRRELFLSSTRAATQQPGLVAKIRLLNLSGQVTMIVPALSVAERADLVEAGIHVVGSEECIGSNVSGGFAIDPAKLEMPRVVVPRLIITDATQHVTLDGVEKHVPQQPFRLLMMLAEMVKTGGGFVSVRAIEAAFSGRPASDLTRELKDYLSDGAAEPKRRIRGLIKNRRSPAGYALALTTTEIEVRP